jgi:hypothetical protein
MPKSESSASSVSSASPAYAEYCALGEEVARLGGKAANLLMWLYGTLAADAGGLSYADGRLRLIDGWRSTRANGEVQDVAAAQAWIELRLRVVGVGVGAGAGVGVGGSEAEGLKRVLSKLAGKGGVWDGDVAVEEWRLLQADRCEGAALTFDKLTRGARWKLYRTDEKGRLKRDESVVSGAVQQRLVGIEKRLARKLCNMYLGLMLEWRNQTFTRAEWGAWKERAAAGRDADLVAETFCWMDSIPDMCERLERLAGMYEGHSAVLIRREIVALTDARSVWESVEEAGGVRLSERETHGRVV